MNIACETTVLGRDDKAPSQWDTHSSPKRESMDQEVAHGSVVLMIEGLTVEVKNRHLREVFVPLGAIASRCQVVYTAAGHAGFGLVKFHSRGAATEAMLKTAGVQVAGVEVRARFATTDDLKSRRKFHAKTAEAVQNREEVKRRARWGPLEHLEDALNKRCFLIDFECAFTEKKGLWVPCEVAVVAFTLASGPEDVVFHRFIDPGPVPPSLQRTAHWATRYCHGIPSCSFALASADYPALWRDLLTFLAPHHPPPLLFAKGRAAEQSCLAWLQAKAGGREGALALEVLELDDLLTLVCHRHNPLAQFPLVDLEDAYRQLRGEPSRHCTYHQTAHKPPLPADEQDDAHMDSDEADDEDEDEDCEFGVSSGVCGARFEASAVEASSAGASEVRDTGRGQRLTANGCDGKRSTPQEGAGVCPPAASHDQGTSEAGAHQERRMADAALLAAGPPSSDSLSLQPPSTAVSTPATDSTSGAHMASLGRGRGRGRGTAVQAGGARDVAHVVISPFTIAWGSAGAPSSWLDVACTWTDDAQPAALQPRPPAVRWSGFDDDEDRPHAALHGQHGSCSTPAPPIATPTATPPSHGAVSSSQDHSASVGAASQPVHAATRSRKASSKREALSQQPFHCALGDVRAMACAATLLLPRLLNHPQSPPH